MFPFHFITEVKKNMYPDTWEKKYYEVLDTLIIPGQYERLQKQLDEKCFGNPIGPQGMLILGAITCAWALKK